MDFMNLLRICLIFEMWILIFVASLFSLPVSDKDADYENDRQKREVQNQLTASDVHDGQTPQEKAEVERTLQILQQKSIQKHGAIVPHTAAAASAASVASNKPYYLFEMDIVLTPNDAHRKLTSQTGRVKRKFTAEKIKKWQFPIPYSFDLNNATKHNDSEKKSIERAIAYWELSTCIRFKDISDTKNTDHTRTPHLLFTKATGCWSYVGRQTTIIPQEISIGTGCFGLGTVAHEIGHAIGFWHEHSRPDRDEWITVRLEHVDYMKWYNFEVESWGRIIGYNVPYDVGSLLHYAAQAFSDDTEITVQTNDPLQQKSVGQRIYLTFYDIKLANIAYCTDICAGVKLNCMHDGYPDPRNCSTCRCPDGFGGRFCEQSAKPYGVSCGGNYKIESGVLEITSPDYPNEYKRSEACNWYIVGPNGTNLYLTFETPFMNANWCAKAENAYLCWDFVEVRYGTNLANTGAKFCCGTTPSSDIKNGIIVSKTNKMLVMYRSLYNGDFGFKVKVTIAGCGGCYATKLPNEPACERRIPYKCAREWKEKVICPSWWDEPCSGFTTRMRYATCFRNMKYCCGDYVQYGSKCYAPNEPLPTGGEVILPIKGEPIPVKETKTIANDVSVGWSRWSTWSNCSQPCGGCGTQNRTRTCESSCGNERRQTERQTCNTNPCSNRTVQLCPEKVKVMERCGGMWSWDRCERYQLQMKPCIRPCCAGFVLVGEQCVPNPV